MGLAAIVGMLFYIWHMDLSSRRVGIFGILCLFAIVAGNIAYVWLKKDPQYIERAAATRQLVLSLNDLTPRLGTGKSVCIENFPLDPSVGTEATRWFSSIPPQNVIFSNPCEANSHEAVLHWSVDQGLTNIQAVHRGDSLEAPLIINRHPIPTYLRVANS